MMPSAAANRLAARQIMICDSRLSKVRSGSSTATLGCVGFATVACRLSAREPTNPHSQEWLCYSPHRALKSIWNRLELIKYGANLAEEQDEAPRNRLYRPRLERGADLRELHSGTRCVELRRFRHRSSSALA